MSQREHFVDEIWHRLKERIIEKAHIFYVEKSSTEGGNKSPEEPLSITILARNFQVLSQKGRDLSTVIRSIGQIFTWKKPDMTFAFLLLFTWGCIYPHYFLLYPVLYVLGFLSTKYLQVHSLKPMVVHDDTPVERDDGMLRLHPLHHSNNDMFGWLWQFEDNQLSNSCEVDTGDNNYFYEDIDNLLDDSEEEETQEASLLRNLSQIQNTTSNVLKVIHSIELSIRSYCNFINEVASTQLFLKLSIVALLITVLGSYIPWRTVFILIMWIGMAISHPSRDKFIIFITRDDSNLNTPNILTEPPAKKVIKDEGIFCSNNIIIDEPKLIRHAEIFEVQQQSITKVNKYQTSRYMSSPFTTSDEFRKQRKLPSFVNSLHDVKPPEKWKFREDSSWAIDQSCYWIEDLGISNKVYCKEDGWVYDLTEEFRRRRFRRECSTSL